MKLMHSVRLYQESINHPKWCLLYDTKGLPATYPHLQASYDLDHALVLAQMHDFRAGILYLYERAGL